MITHRDCEGWQARLTPKNPFPGPSKLLSDFYNRCGVLKIIHSSIYPADSTHTAQDLWLFDLLWFITFLLFLLLKQDPRKPAWLGILAEPDFALACACVSVLGGSQGVGRGCSHVLDSC